MKIDLLKVFEDKHLNVSELDKRINIHNKDADFDKQVERDYRYNFVIKSFDQMGSQMFSKFQIGNSIQNKRTPFRVLLEMLKQLNLNNIEGKDILVVCNVDVYSYLKELKAYGLITYNSLTLLTDIKELKGKENIEVVDLNEIPYININMKFDVILANPPYNEDISKNENRKDDFHLPSKQIYRNFFKHSLTLLKEDGEMCYIMPTAKWWNVISKSKTQKEYVKEGLVEVRNLHNPFPGVTINNIGLFHINRKAKTPLRDDFVPKQPLDNITRFRIPTGLKAADFRDDLKEVEEGTIVRLTLSQDVRTVSNPEISKDKSVGFWRVGLALNTPSVEKMGKALVIHPSEYLSSSVQALKVSSEEEAIAFAEYLNSKEVADLVAPLRTASTNSLLNMGFVPTPEFLKNV